MTLSLGIGLGIPMIPDQGGGGPPDPNLLSPFDWTAGASTTLSIASGFARATATDGGVNPRIFKGPVTVTNGVTYRVNGAVRSGPDTTNNRFRVGTSPALAADILEVIYNGNTTVDETFVSNGTPVYVGIVALVDAVGEYAEIADDFVLEVDV